jgi:hypothetical protein
VSHDYDADVMSSTVDKYHQFARAVSVKVLQVLVAQRYERIE